MTTEVKLHRFYLPHVAHEGWGLFVIGADGFFSCVTDYGNYGHWWPHQKEYHEGRRDFLDFFSGFDENYIRRKTAPNCEKLDVYATVEVLQRHVLTYRREKRISAGNAREYMEELRGIDDEVDLVVWMRETSMPDAWDNDMQYSIPSDVDAYEKRLLPRLLEAVKQRLAAGKEAA